MNENLTKQLIEQFDNAKKELEKTLPPPPANDNEVSPALEQHLEYQKAQQEKREKEFNKNGFYKGY